MKRFIAIALLTIMLFSFVACGNKEVDCWNCGESVSTSAEFCKNCGSKLLQKAKCLNCNKSISVPTSFCEHCGNSVNDCAYGDCYVLVDKKYGACSEHQCAKSNCDQGKTTQSPFCYVHACYGVISTVNGGVLEVTVCPNGTEDGLRYCSEHKCVEKDCPSEKYSSNYQYVSDFCYNHTCRESDCNNRINGSGFYCSKHECAESGCSLKKESNSNYCYQHD